MHSASFYSNQGQPITNHGNQLISNHGNTGPPSPPLPPPPPPIIEPPPPSSASHLHPPGKPLTPMNPMPPMTLDPFVLAGSRLPSPALSRKASHGRFERKDSSRSFIASAPSSSSSLPPPNAPPPPPLSNQQPQPHVSSITGLSQNDNPMSPSMPGQGQSYGVPPPRQMPNHSPPPPPPMMSNGGSTYPRKPVPKQQSGQTGYPAEDYGSDDDTK